MRTGRDNVCLAVRDEALVIVVVVVLVDEAALLQSLDGEGRDLAARVDERGRRLVVHRGERGQVVDELVQERASKTRVRLGRDRGLLREDDGLGRGRVAGEQAPVDKAAVAQVRVVAASGRELQHLLHKGLRSRGLLQVQLDSGREQLQLHLHGVLLKVLHQQRQQIAGVLDALAILAHNPDHGR